MIEVTYGLSAARSKNLSHKILSDINQFADFIRDGSTHVSKLDAEVDTFAAWHSLTKKQRDKLKVKGGYIIAGQTAEGAKRNTESVTAVKLLILDLDSGDLSQHEVTLKVRDWTCAYFETANSVGGARRWRVALPLNIALSVGDFKQASANFLKLNGISADSCSSSPAQAQMLPIIFDDYCPTVHVNEGSYLDLTAYLTVAPGQINAAPIEGDEGLKNYRRPLESVTTADIVKGLESVDAHERDVWIQTGMGLHHQFGGSDEGLQVWDAWSSKATAKWDDACCAAAWEGFNTQLSDRAPVTIRTVLKDLGRQEAAESRESLRGAWARKISMCADEGEIREVFTVEICHEWTFGEYDRNLLAQSIQVRLAELAVTSTGRTVKPHPISEVREWLNPKRLSANTPPNKGERLDELDRWPEGWVYLQNGDEFLELATKRRCSSRGFQAEFNRRMTGADGVLMAPADIYALSLCETPIPICAQRIYAPGKPVVFTDEDTGVKYANEWNEHTVPVAWPREVWGAGDNSAVVNFLKLLTLIIPKTERKTFFYYMCWIVQNEGSHMNWAPVIQGPQGAGKTMLSEILRAALGAENARSIDAHVLGSGFTSWAQGSVLNTIEEIRLPGEKGSAHAIINSLKPYITNARISIHRKGRDPYEVPNSANYLFLTNHEDAIPLEAGDRRYFVVFTTPRTGMDVAIIVKQRPQFFERVYDAYTNHPEALRGYMLGVKIPDSFQPFGHAPHTQAKDIMGGNTKPGDEQALTEVLSEVYDGVNGPSGVLHTAAVTQRMRSEFSVTVRPARLGMLLRAAGWEKFGKLRWRGTPRTIYIKPRLSGLQNLPGEAEQILALLDASVGGEFL